MDSKEPPRLLSGGLKSKNLKFILADKNESRMPQLEKIGFYTKHVSGKVYKTDVPRCLSYNNFVKRASASKIKYVTKELDETKENYDMIFGFCTIVVLDRMDHKTVEKPRNREEALYALRMYKENKRHSVITGVTIFDSSTKKSESFCVETKVEFGDIDDEMLQEYVQTDKWKNNITVYSLNDESSGFIKAVDGCPSNISGVPHNEFIQTFRKIMLDQSKELGGVNKENVLNQQQETNAKENEKEKEDVELEQQNSANQKEMKKDDVGEKENGGHQQKQHINDNEDGNVEAVIAAESKPNVSGDEKKKPPTPAPRPKPAQKKPEAIGKDVSSARPIPEKLNEKDIDTVAKASNGIAGSSATSKNPVYGEKQNGVAVVQEEMNVQNSSNGNIVPPITKQPAQHATTSVASNYDAPTPAAPNTSASTQDGSRYGEPIPVKGRFCGTKKPKKVYNSETNSYDWA